MSLAGNDQPEASAGARSQPPPLPHLIPGPVAVIGYQPAAPPRPTGGMIAVALLGIVFGIAGAFALLTGLVGLLFLALGKPMARDMAHLPMHSPLWSAAGIFGILLMVASIGIFPLARWARKLAMWSSFGLLACQAGIALTAYLGVNSVAASVGRPLTPDARLGAAIAFFLIYVAIPGAYPIVVICLMSRRKWREAFRRAV